MAARIAFVALAGCIVLLPSLATANEYRSRAVAQEFQRQHPCPSTGRMTGTCPGYVRDHVVPLACGGADSVSNLQWPDGLCCGGRMIIVEVFGRGGAPRGPPSGRDQDLMR